MKLSKWVVSLTAAGLMALSSIQAEEQYPVNTALSSTTLSGYVDTSFIWQPGISPGPDTLPGTVAAVPEPGVYGLLAVGGLVFSIARARRRK